jgi:hypothetical protein
MRSVIPGLEAPDPVLERDVRARLEEVEAALEKAVHADSEMLAETARYLLAAGGKRFRPMLVLLSGYFGDPSDPRLIPGGRDRARPRGDAVPRRRDRRGRVPPRRPVRQRQVGQHGRDPDG